MVTKDIEKEIQQDNKIFLGLTGRQFAALGIGLAVSIILTLVVSWDISMYLCLPIGVLCYFIGWRKKDGLTYERYLFKLFKQKFYHSNTRSYRTKNRYVPLMNAEYKRHRQIDMANKKIAKRYKKELKKAAKQQKKSHLKAIA